MGWNHQLDTIDFRFFLKTHKTIQSLLLLPPLKRGNS